MAALTVGAIHSRISSAVDTALGATWKQSRFAPDRFGQDTDQLLPKCFAVQVGNTSPTAADRQNLTEGVWVTTDLSVRFALRLRGDAQTSDYRAALDAEQSIVQAVLAASLTDLQLRLVDFPARGSSADGSFFLGDAAFSARHLYALA